MTSDLNHPKRTTSPLSGSLSKKPRAIGKGNDVTDVITNERELTTFAGPVPPTTPSLPPGKTSFSNHALASSTKKKSKKAKNSTPSPSETIVSNKKGKSKAIQEDISHSEGSSSDSDSDESDEESTPPQSSPAKRGRPRRDAVKQAAKSMAKK
ncbi:hypothetical protein MJO28_011141 [Puccinia striiformis f. sp. tritici]|uniref:Uncharacterized protein n=1 Tax=Puccinia striiformis f. sp. tritici TaxID=168172 RepID=A0ACC0E4A3_9BASI|nr:hypothetical protein MJO28_011141 [Puccinia striiformis f. sp. tritici]